MSSAHYCALLRTPGASAFFLTATFGRVGIAMTSLGIVWLVHARTDSYASAGLVAGGFAVAEGVVGPQLARLIDRFGQTRVLPAALLAHAVSVVVLLLLVSGDSPAWLMTVGGVLLGATIPQLGALSAARWSALLRGSRSAELPTAFALESLSNGFAYLAGPVVVSVLGASGHPAWGAASAAALIVVGGLALAAQRRTAPPPASGAAEVRHASRSLLRPGFVLLIGINVAIGGYFGASQVAVTAFAVEHDSASAAAWLFAASSCAGLVAGWVYGLRRWRPSASAQLGVLAVGLAVGSLVRVLSGSPLQLGVLLVITGLAIPPILVLCSVLTERTVHPVVLTQAFTWLNSASAAGAAAIAALSGQVVDSFGARGGLAAAAGASVLIAVLAVLRLLPKRLGR